MGNHKNMGSGAGGAGASVSGSVTVSRPSDSWRDHPLVRQRYFHVLPLDLLSEVEPLLDLDYRKQLPWHLERRLSKAASAQPDTVGFWDGQYPVRHPFLFSRPHEEEEEGGGSDIQSILKAARREMEGHTGPTGRRRPLNSDMIAGAYCGWLMTSHPFLQEHNALLDQQQKTLGSNSQLASPSGPFESLASGRLADPSSPLVRAYQNLCGKWRLDRLAGPYLPVPTAPGCTVLAEPTVIHRQMPPGRFVHVPDIYGDLAADQVAVSPSPVVGSTSDRHLAPWLEILSPANRNKGKQVRRYVRLFALLHVWRALRHRHGQAIRRRLGPIREVLADHFAVKASTIRWNLGRS